MLLKIKQGIFNKRDLSITPADALFVKITETVAVRSILEKNKEIFSALLPLPEAKIAIFFTHQKYNKQLNVEIDKV